jgi:hypothetical protein
VDATINPTASQNAGLMDCPLAGAPPPMPGGSAATPMGDPFLFNATPA